MRHLDEGTIHAWLDQALAPEAVREVEAHVLTCEECGAAVAEARGLAAASSRILSNLDAVPGGVIPPSAPEWHSGAWRARGAASFGWWSAPNVRRVAAAVAFLAVGSAVGARFLRRADPRRAITGEVAQASVPASDSTSRSATAAPAPAAPRAGPVSAASDALPAARRPRARKASVASRQESPPAEQAVADLPAPAVPRVAALSSAARDGASGQHGLSEYQRVAAELNRSAGHRTSAPDTVVVARYLETKEALENRLMADAADSDAATEGARDQVAASKPTASRAAPPPVSGGIPGVPGSRETERLRADGASGMVVADGTVERLRLVSSTLRLDGRRTVRVRLYQLLSGEYVSLIITDMLPTGAAVPLRTFTGRDLDVTNSDWMLSDQMIPGMHSITWTGPLGTRYRLAGPFTTPDLTEIRKLLPPPQLPQP